MTGLLSKTCNTHQLPLDVVGVHFKALDLVHLKLCGVQLQKHGVQLCLQCFLCCPLFHQLWPHVQQLGLKWSLSCYHCHLSPSRDLSQINSSFCYHSWLHYSKHCDAKLKDIVIFSSVDSIVCTPRSGELQTQKLKSHQVRTQSWNGLPLKPGVGQYIAIHAMLTARIFSLFLPFQSIHLHFFQNLSQFFSCVGCG